VRPRALLGGANTGRGPGQCGLAISRQKSCLNSSFFFKEWQKRGASRPARAPPSTARVASRGGGRPGVPGRRAGPARVGYARVHELNVRNTIERACIETKASECRAGQARRRQHNRVRGPAKRHTTKKRTTPPNSQRLHGASPPATARKAASACQSVGVPCQLSEVHCGTANL